MKTKTAPNSDTLSVMEPQEEFITTEEVEQEIVPTVEVEQDVPVDIEGENDDDDEMMNDDEEALEVDMSNNSLTYFDKHTDSVFAIGHHPNLPLVCTGGGDNLAHLWTSHSQPPKFAGTLTGYGESVISCSFTSEGGFLVTADMSGKVLVHMGQKGGAQWKLASQMQEVEEIVWLKTHPTIARTFAFGATDGSVWCYQINEQDGSLEQLMSGFVHQQDCSMGEFINTDKGENTLELVTCSLDSTIVAWNCFTGQQLFKITQAEIKGLEAPWISLSLAPATLTKGNSGVVACGSNNGLLAVINCNNGGAILHLSTVIELQPEQDELDASVESISWSSKFSLMAIGLVCGEILLYDTSAWRVRHKFVLEDSVTKLMFDNDDLFASCINGKVYQFNARTGQEKFVCVGHNMGVLDFILLHPVANTGTEQKRKVITAGDEGVSLVFEVPN